ncbi:type I secretion system permease/ATPase [Vibrio sp. ZSDZ65]|uniref:Type I secretion system permease/ATPase n=1 Tax=Vibrio qingdaonensis TaxID=2829491 RepID=A0A9X3CK61_9VIBR|nr:type I secretion system permease/ATPase [Vibrio qingdaonensis]MCW8344725.1 type I secretion system permease/ATPase [Vibrio qingdaonensis]
MELTEAKGLVNLNNTQYFKFSKKVFTFIAIVSVAVNILFLVLPLFSMQVFDRVLSSESRETLVMLASVALFLLSIQALLDWVRGQVMLRYGYGIEQHSSDFAFNIAMLKSQENNGVHSQPLSDLSRVKEVIASPGIFALFDAPFAPVFLAVMYLMHPLLGHFALIGATVLFVISLLSLLVTKRLQNNASQHAGTFNALTSDWLKNAEIVQALGMNDNLVAKWRKESINPTVDKATADKISRGILALAKYARMLLQIGVLCVSVILVLENEVGAGVLIAASMIMSRVLAPVEQAIHNWQSWLEGWKAHKRLRQAYLEQADDVVELPKIKGTIQFEKVNLGHHGSEKPLLEDLSFVIPAGASVAIVGGSGVGKSTLVKAMLGLVIPVNGQVRIDGATLNQRQVSELGKQVGYVSQNSQLLSGTIAQNICRFDEQVEAKDIVDAAKLAGVHEMILALPNGYQTLVGGLGIRLSGGQQQRIAMARALYTKPALLILDEPDSNLDHPGQAALTEFIAHAHYKRITVVVISHRMSIIQHTGLCMVLGEGRIQQYGKTSDILNIPKSNESGMESAS